MGDWAVGVTPYPGMQPPGAEELSASAPGWSNGLTAECSTIIFTHYSIGKLGVKRVVKIHIC